MPSSSSTSSAPKRKSNASSSPGSFNKKPKKQQPPPTKQDRQSQRKHAGIVIEGKRIWNQLRLKNNTPEQTRALVDELLPLVTGKAAELALQHDASRVVQAALQFSNESERTALVRELCPTLVELCKSQYGSFCVVKCITYCGSSTKKNKNSNDITLLCQALTGHMAKLAVHATASRVVESVFTTFKPKHTNFLKQELYGPHCALFASDVVKSLAPASPTLAANMKKLEDSPSKHEATFDFVRQLVSKLCTKQLYGHGYVQDILLEYSLAATPSYIRTLATSVADHLLHLLATRAGTHVACRIIAYATPKDRKRAIKSLKGYTRSGLVDHTHAYLVVLQIVQLTDDTVLVQKNVLNELLTNPNELKSTKADSDSDAAKSSPLLELALSDTAHKLFLLLLADDAARTKILDPYELEVLNPNPTILENGVEVPTSKKQPSVRRKELLKQMREPLIQLCSQHADQLLLSIPGSLVLSHVYSAFHPISVVEAVLEACSKNKSSTFEHVVGHRAVKALILADDGSDPNESSFASHFLARFSSSMLQVAESNRGAFVVAALVKVLGKNSSAKGIDESQLTKKVKAAKSKGKQGGPTAGYEAILKEIA